MKSEDVDQVDEETHQHSKVNVIPVHLVEESYESHDLSSPGSNNITRGKYYKQTYRPAWEQMPDFKGWLRGVEGEPTRAYCTYCQKTLHAHRLSLLKHTCTIRHQRAAQIHSTRKGKGQMMMDHQNVKKVVMNSEGSMDQDELEGEEVETIIEYTESGEIEDGEEDHDTEHDPEDDEDNESVSLQYQAVQVQKQSQQVRSVKPPISTHVIDTTRGTPVSGLQVSLYKLVDGRWTYINEGVTNTGGRFSQFLDRLDFTPGRYKLHYDVDRYFEARKQEYLYPFIEIVFDSNVFTENYHIPILLGPFGYTTYRGS